MINPCDYCDERKISVFVVLALVLVGFVIGVLTMKVMVKESVHVSAPLLAGVDCRACHVPALKTLKAYKAYHRQIAKTDPLLTELVKP